jgi:phospholipid/cholesterol/gamma-HCH transport system substrate-binding protein
MELDDRRLALRVGLLICVGLALLIVMIGFFQSFSFRKNFYAVEATFPFGGGIKKGTPVRIAGYNVGQVKGVTWDSDTQLVRVMLQIEVTHRVKRDAILILDSEGMLGETYLEFTAGSPEAPDLESGSTIKGEVPPTMTQMKVESLQMIQKITGAVSQIESLAAHLNSIAGDQGFKDNLKTTVESTARIAEQAALSAEGFRKISEDVSAVMTGVNTLVSRLNDTAEQLAEQIKARGEQTGNVLSEAQALLKELRESNQKLNEGLESLAAITLKVHKGDGTVHKLIYERELYDRTNSLVKEANVAAKRLADLAKYLRHNPSHLVWGAEPSWYKRWWRKVLGTTWGEEEMPPPQDQQEQSSTREGRKPEEKINIINSSLEKPESDRRGRRKKPVEGATKDQFSGKKPVEESKPKAEEKTEEEAPADEEPDKDDKSEDDKD